MDLPTSEDVVDAIEAFLIRHDMKPSRFGAEATGDANLVASLRGGSSPRLERLHRIRDYIDRKDVEAGFRCADHVGSDTSVASVLSAGNEAGNSREAVTHA